MALKNLSPKIFAEKIFYFEEIIENPQDIVEGLEASDNMLTDSSLLSAWHPWESSSGDHTFGYRKFTNPDEYSKAEESIRWIYNVIHEALSAAGSHYSEALSVPLGTSAPISVSKYLPNEYMGPHADEGDPRAHFSAVLYLNDNFDGGGLEFPNQDVFIFPKAGSIIVFPSWQPYIHDPKPATENKYISPAFWFVENSPFKTPQV